jgi:uncharacterized protein YecT (DUF1311 family)
MSLKFLAAIVSIFFLATQPALAIDCTKALSKVEKAICASPDLMAKDKKLNEAYLKLLKTLDPIQRKAAVATQRFWNETAFEDAVAGRELNTLEQVMSRRINFLSSKAEFTTGERRLPQPVFIANFEGKENYSARVELLQFYQPNTFAELRFNQEAIGLIGSLGAAKYIGFDWAGGYGHVEDSTTVELNFSMRTVLATENLLVAEVKWDDVSNRLPHPGFGSTSLIFDTKNSRALSFEDLFVEGAVDEMIKFCSAQYQDFAWHGDENPPEDLSGYRAAIFELGDWRFSPLGATWVMSRPSNRPSYGWGCHLESKILPRFANKESMFWLELCRPDLKFYSKEICRDLLS